MKMDYIQRHLSKLVEELDTYFKDETVLWFISFFEENISFENSSNIILRLIELARFLLTKLEKANEPEENDASDTKAENLSSKTNNLKLEKEDSENEGSFKLLNHYKIKTQYSKCDSVPKSMFTDITFHFSDQKVFELRKINKIFRSNVYYRVTNALTSRIQEYVRFKNTSLDELDDTLLDEKSWVEQILRKKCSAKERKTYENEILDIVYAHTGRYPDKFIQASLVMLLGLTAKEIHDRFKQRREKPKSSKDLHRIYDNFVNFNPISDLFWND